MSGIYLTIWDEAQTGLLSATKTGWPHVTLAHTGKHLSRNELVELSHRCFAEWALREITLVKAYVNSFEESKGSIRHDVLIELAASDAALVVATRQVYLAINSKAARFTMRVPHVPHSTHLSIGDAQIVAAQLNAAALPRAVRVTGVTID